ncbi:MAG: hypothetical protein KatS3mg129_2877 [Leptospiraceae bacterium]|nr:MAG: hypothetical protein KatS3mg129_2877 [Leptospiraceae bacterium]
MKHIYYFILFFIFFIDCSSNPINQFFKKEYEPIVILTYHDEVSSVAILLEELNLKFQPIWPDEPYTHNAFSVIVLGEKFPINKFKEILTFIRNYYPELHYIQLVKENPNIPEKNLYTLYIGASTDIAIKNHLKAWDDKDFQKLLELNSKEEIHRYIMQKNQGISISKPTGQ